MSKVRFLKNIMSKFENDIQVSVCVTTYNQEGYIRECLESLVTQITNFKFEIIIGEDCSTDNTRHIVQEYVEKYPDLIVPIFHLKNIGPIKNLKQVYLQAKGKYIAHVDGDDMACSGKLQKQFDVLEAHPEAIICSHNMIEILDNTIVKKDSWSHPAGEYNLVDLIKKLPFFAHSSKLFRVIDNKDLCSLLNDPHVLDLELHLYQASMGSIIHLEENLGYYRAEVGISAIKNDKLNYNMIKRVLMIYEKLLVAYPDINHEIRRSYAMSLLSMANRSAVFEPNGKKMKEYAIRSVKQDLFSSKQVLMVLLCLSPNLGASILKYRYKLRKTKAHKNKNS